MRSGVLNALREGISFDYFRTNSTKSVKNVYNSNLYADKCGDVGTA